MSPDPFFNSDPDVMSCQEICPWTGQAHFCGARIHPDCLEIRDDGLTRVGLSMPAGDWFAALSQMGEVLQIVRNPLAAVGQVGVLPSMVDWRNPVLPRDAMNSFNPNLAQYAQIWAIRECSPLGVAYGLEATSLSGDAFHRVFLVKPAQRDWFEQFVIDHQSPPMEVEHWCPPNHADGLRRCRAIENRVDFLRSRRAVGAAEVRQLPVEMIPFFLAALVETRLLVRTTHYHPALNRAVVWTPDVIETATGDNPRMRFLHGEGVGMQINLSAVGSIWLWQGTCSSCDQQHWTIEIADANDRVGLAFTAGNESLEMPWRNLLKEVCHEQ